MGALIVALTQLFKVTLNVSKRYIPITTVVMSLVVFSLYTLLTGLDFTWEILSSSLMAGLTACGLWSGVKTTLTK